VGVLKMVEDSKPEAGRTLDFGRRGGTFILRTVFETHPMPDS
jgi:hypothetical protein